MRLSEEASFSILITISEKHLGKVVRALEFIPTANMSIHSIQDQKMIPPPSPATETVEKKPRNKAPVGNTKDENGNTGVARAVLAVLADGPLGRGAINKAVTMNHGYSGDPHYPLRRLLESHQIKKRKDGTYALASKAETN
jgi:hypothetical protein